MNDGYLHGTNKKVTEKAVSEYSTLKYYQNESLLIAMYGATIGKLAIPTFGFVCNQACCVLSEPKNDLLRFYFYWFKSHKKFIVDLGYGGGQPNISQDLIKNLRVPTPPKPEQNAIVAFLDEKTSKIDELIAKKERKIELLKEQRKVLINQAVTKGLDPEVPMKDSGVEWIGKIPVGWDVSKLKFNFNFATGFAFKSNEYDFDEGIKLIRGINVKEGLLNYNDIRYWNRETKGLEEFFLSDKDVLIGMDGSKVGKNFAMINEWNLPALLVQRVARLRSKDNNLQKWLYYNLASSRFLDWVTVRKTDPAVPHISPDDINNFQVCICTSEEMSEIIQVLEVSLEGIDELVNKESKKIELLKEYRQALISEVVTGKVDIRKTEKA